PLCLQACPEPGTGAHVHTYGPAVGICGSSGVGIDGHGIRHKRQELRSQCIVLSGRHPPVSRVRVSIDVLSCEFVGHFGGGNRREPTTDGSSCRMPVHGSNLSVFVFTRPPSSTREKT